MSPTPSDQAPASRQDEDAQAREFDAFAASQDGIELDAATWALRRREGLAPEDEAAFQAWLAADPRHAPALAEMDATFGQLRALRPIAGARRRPARAGRHLATAGLACVLAVAGWLGWDHWRQQPVFERSYATRPGQQLSLTLPDGPQGAAGSRLTLDTGSRLRVVLYRDRRELQLAEGQALFAVRRDAARPFHVQAGALRVTVLGTQFTVRRTSKGLDAGQTVVAVKEGRVRVARSPDLPWPAAGAVELGAGQAVAAGADGVLGAVARTTPSSVSAWQEGRIAFEGATLAAAVAEFERYGRTGLVIRDPEVAALRVGGSYELRQVQRFADALPQVLPVRLVPHGNDVEIVLNRRSSK
ncbi:hypothetical protein B0920_22030 [Massilia sp. KIM]|uniref:FecR family protein n=1 Tax=Massilia sp. KIM TaxID=1955422 RepID=UPI00098EF9A1|nr:FecR domain-containing protein [Massilia sp. KIM]OON59953.1 hypothetical protein B0920_22030 [Massilia sp. KIM]